MRLKRSTSIVTNCWPMQGEPRVMAVASDAGSARALLPVLHTLMARGATIGPALAGPAAEIFATELGAIKPLPIGDDATEAQFTDAIRHFGAHALVTGAGRYNNIEHTARLAARTVGIPAVAVLDYWYEYQARFHRPSGEREAESWPD